MSEELIRNPASGDSVAANAEKLAEKFNQAYAMEISDEDIEWKDMGGGGRAKLAYLNWAVAWRLFKQVYPDGNYYLIDAADENPVWNVNGYAMLKCAVSAMGKTYIEFFPIMDNRNASMKVENVDGRDINDSAQRGWTKCIARFGIGLKLYEGKVKPHYDNAKAVPPARQERTIYCGTCRKPIVASGKMSAQQVAEYTMKTFGKPLCVDCAKKAKAALAKAKAKEEAPAPNPAPTPAPAPALAKQAAPKDPTPAPAVDDFGEISDADYEEAFASMDD